MNYFDKRKAAGAIFIDFDGTLYNSDHYIAEENYAALKEARDSGYITAINTGRSLFSFKRAAVTLDKSMADYFDFLIFSSGAGIIDLKDGSLFEAKELESELAFEAAEVLFKDGLDFMIHNRVPENHRFVYVKSNGAVNPDFYRRMNIYEGLGQSLGSDENNSDLDRIKSVCNNGVSQLLAVVPPSVNDNRYSEKLMDYLQKRLGSCTVIRTTSPLDKKSLWIEIFSPDVSKAKTAERLAARFGIGAESSLAVGNDFNDLDMLKWAGTGRSVDEAPDQIKRLYPSAGRSSDSAVAAAIREFITLSQP